MLWTAQVSPQQPDSNPTVSPDFAVLPQALTRTVAHDCESMTLFKGPTLCVLEDDMIEPSLISSVLLER